MADAVNSLAGMETTMIACGKYLARVSLTVLVALILPNAATAQTAAGAPGKAASIGQEMEALTAKFNNPDPIVEMDAYNGAFANPNPIIRQMALSSAANSTNPEIRAIAVVGAMAHVKSLVLTLTAPNNDGQSNSSATEFYNVSGGMVTIQIEKFDNNDNSFSYVTDDSRKSYNLMEKHFGEGSIMGETIQMNLKWDESSFSESCPTILTLKNGKLSGTISCTGNYTIIRAPVTASIF